MNWYFRVLKKYATFEGRARRKEYWYFKLFHNLIIYALLLYGFYNALTTPHKEDDFFFAFFGAIPTLFWLYLLATFLPNLAVSARRLHDINRSGEHLLMWFVAPVGPLVLFIFFAMPGTPGYNKFGPDPITTKDEDIPPKTRKRRPDSSSNRRRSPYPPREQGMAQRRSRENNVYPQSSSRYESQEYDESDRYDDEYNEYDEQDYDAQGDAYPSQPPPYGEVARKRPRRRSALYGLDNPVSNEGVRYQDPFASNLLSKVELNSDQMRRFGLIDEGSEEPLESTPAPYPNEQDEEIDYQEDRQPRREEKSRD